jgi:hypothetical protein
VLIKDADGESSNTMTTPENPPWNRLGFKGLPPDGRRLTEEELDTK